MSVRVAPWAPFYHNTGDPIMDIENLSKDSEEYKQFIEDKKELKLFNVSIETETTVLAKSKDEAEDIFWEYAANDMLNKYDTGTFVTEIKKCYENELPWYSDEDYTTNLYVRYIADNGIFSKDILKDLELLKEDPNQLHLNFEKTNDDSLNI